MSDLGVRGRSASSVGGRHHGIGHSATEGWAAAGSVVAGCAAYLDGGQLLRVAVHGTADSHMYDIGNGFIEV